MRRAQHIVCFAAALLAAAALATPALPDKADDTIRFAAQSVLPNVDSYFNNATLGAIIADNVWDGLIYRDPDTGAYEGNLATAWRWIDDHTLELDLRQGIQFHNGAEFSADDVVFTLGFVSSPETKAPAFGRVRWIDRVEKLDRYKVRIVAKQAFPTAIAYLAGPKMAIHPHEYYAKVGPKGMNEKPIGTGPYRVGEHELGKYIRLERNSAYFEGGPKPRAKVGKVEMRFIPDAQTRVAEAVASGADLITSIGRDQAEQLRDLSNLQVVSGESVVYAVLRMNTLSSTPAPQLKDIRVRQAIMHAIDREAMARFLIGEGARVLHAECHPTEFGCDDAVAPRYAYDPIKARQLLADAGYPNGFDIDLYAYRDRNETEALMGYLGGVGIRARLRFIQAAAMTSAQRAGRVALSASGWSSFNFDASDSVARFHEFSSDDMNRDPEIRDLLLRADSAMDPRARRDAYAKALGLIQERAYVLPLYSLPAYYIAAKTLVFKPDPDGNLKFYEMSWK